MAEGPKQIIVLDDHFLRGAAIAALLSRQAADSGLRMTQLAPHQFADGDGSFSADEVAACIYVIGGGSIGRPQIVLPLKRYLAVLEERPLILLADEFDAEGIDLAIALGVRGVIPTRLTSDIALAAVQFILAGGHYYPHPISQARSPSACAAERPSLPASAGAHEDGSGACLRLPLVCAPDAPQPGHSTGAAGGCEDERCVEARVGDRTLLLTSRQFDVMRWLERGLSNKAIGQKLDLSESTVKLHVRHLLRKLRASNRTQIALLASSAHWELERSGRSPDRLGCSAL